MFLDEKNIFNSLKKTLDFDYPELIDFSKPTQPLAPTVIQTPNQNKIIQENTESLIQNETVNKITISNKEEIKKLPIQKPVVNRSIKPVDQEIKSDKKLQIKYELLSDEETDEEELKKDSEIFRNSQIIKQPKHSTPILPPSQPTSQSTIMLSNNQSITNIKFVPPQPSQAPTTTSIVDNSNKNEKNIASNIFDTVYKPNRIKPIQMKDGASKVLDVNTGLFKIYSTSIQPPPKPNIVQLGDKAKLQNESLSTIRKDELEPKFTSKTNEISNNNKKLALKRTLSIPNISNMDDDITNKSNDENVPKFKPTDTHLNELDADKTKQSANLKSSIINKPVVNRESKPMPMNEITNLHRSRIPELQPIYGDVPPGLTGIKNLGNTCFMNSIIQCLNSTYSLVDYFISGQFRKDLNRTNELGFKGEIADEFSVIVSASWSGHCKTIAPRRFKNILGQFNQQFISNEQQDAQELLLFLLDGLHEDLNKV